MSPAGAVGTPGIADWPWWWWWWWWLGWVSAGGFVFLALLPLLPLPPPLTALLPPLPSPLPWRLLPPSPLGAVGVVWPWPWPWLAGAEAAGPLGTRGGPEAESCRFSSVGTPGPLGGIELRLGLACFFKIAIGAAGGEDAELAEAVLSSRSRRLRRSRREPPRARDALGGS